MTILSAKATHLAELADLVVCFLFWCKAAWDLYRAPLRMESLRWDWADSVASIASVSFLRPIRALQLVIIREIRATTCGVHELESYFNVDRTRSVVATVFALVVISVLTSSFVVLGVEAGTQKPTCSPLKTPCRRR